MTTQFANASYQEIIDLNTETNTVSAIGVHTPSSSTPVDMLQGFWKQFQKVRYDGCSVTLVPAARLPVDPLGVSYDAGESQIDPRDLLNPVLFHGCHGNDMGIILNQLYNGTSAVDSSNPSSVLLGSSDSMEQIGLATELGVQLGVEPLYYKALTDNTWKKADPSRGFKKSGLRPLVHDLAVSAPFGVAKHAEAIIKSNSVGYSGLGAPSHTEGSGSSDSYVETSDVGLDNNGLLTSKFGSYPVITHSGIPGSSDEMTGIYPFTTSQVQFVTNRLRSLGWLDTQSPFARQITGINNATSVDNAPQTLADVIASDQKVSHAVQNTIPKLYMGMILLPPAYKTKQYYRMIINHHFSFAKFRGMSMMNFTTSEVDNAYGYHNAMRNV